jgi:hypothetical protein
VATELDPADEVASGEIDDVEGLVDENGDEDSSKPLEVNADDGSDTDFAELTVVGNLEVSILDDEGFEKENETVSIKLLELAAADEDDSENTEVIITTVEAIVVVSSSIVEGPADDNTAVDDGVATEDDVTRKLEDASELETAANDDDDSKDELKLDMTMELDAGEDLTELAVIGELEDVLKAVDGIRVDDAAGKEVELPNEKLKDDVDRGGGP